MFAGDDGLALPVLALGGAGLISVASNVIPAQMAEMVRAGIRNDWATARRINRHFFRLMQAHFWEPSPAPVKAVLAILGTRRGDSAAADGSGDAERRGTSWRCCAGELGLMVHAPGGSKWESKGVLAAGEGYPPLPGILFKIYKTGDLSLYQLS